MEEHMDNNSVNVTIEVNGQAGAVMIAEPKVFSTGKHGFWNQVKFAIGDKRYQAQIQIVEIVPKA
jgi:hypothetical protein